MTAALGPWIMRHPEVKNNMEQFMLQFVKPVLMDGNSVGYNRAIVRVLATFLGCALRFYGLLQALEILGTVTKAGLTFSNKRVFVEEFIFE
jgi:hypothetical protein